MTKSLDPFRFLLIPVSGWMNQQQLQLIDYLRELVARKFDGSACRQSIGRPRVEKGIEDLIVRMAQENPSWDYDRMGHCIF